MTTDDITPDPEDAPTIDPVAASIQGGETFRGQPLNAWTPPCKIASQSMGMMYPFIGDGGFEAIERTGLYPGALNDVIIFLWLRLQKPSDVLKAQRKPAEAHQSAVAWAETNNLLDLTGDEFKEGYELFQIKMEALYAAKKQPVQPDNLTPFPAQDSTSPKV
jgi:hypothetical protein